SGGAGPNRDGTETSADEADTAADADGSTPAAVDAEAEGGEPGAGSESDAASASKDGDDLPRTGTELALPIGLGAGTILLGALLLAASRRRRSALHCVPPRQAKAQSRSRCRSGHRRHGRLRGRCPPRPHRRVGQGTCSAGRLADQLGPTITGPWAWLSTP